MRRSATLVVALAVATVLVAGVSGCASAPSADAGHPAALAVEKLLELRHARSKDATAYALFFKSDAIPQSLADASAKETTATKPPIPEWQAPYVSSVSSASADVVVLWKSDAAFPGHSAGTVFTLERYQNRWVVVDASDVRDAAKAPPPLRP